MVVPVAIVARERILTLPLYLRVPNHTLALRKSARGEPERNRRDDPRMRDRPCYRHPLQQDTVRSATSLYLRSSLGVRSVEGPPPAISQSGKARPRATGY